MNFKDARARRAWRLYFLRAEAVLSPLAASVRRELIGDLKAHVGDILANEDLQGDDAARLSAALARVGDPKEFLAPLVAEAVFRAPPGQGSFGMAYRTITLYAARGTIYFLRAFGLVLIASAAIAFGLAALNSLLRPERAGVFLTGPDEYQVKILGLSAAVGEQVLAPWMAVVVVLLSTAAIAWTARRTRRMLLELIAS